MGSLVNRRIRIFRIKKAMVTVDGFSSRANSLTKSKIADNPKLVKTVFDFMGSFMLVYVYSSTNSSGNIPLMNSYKSTAN